MSQVKADRKVAKQANQNVLIIILGYGSPAMHGTKTGRNYKRNVTINKLNLRVKAFNTQYTLHTAACYSGD